MLSVSYDAAGRAQRLSHPHDAVSATFDEAGRVATLTTASGVSLTHLYDGSWLTGVTWSGALAGSVQNTYDNNFQPVRRTVSGAYAQTFAYDPDGLIAQAGELVVNRDAQKGGVVTGTVLGGVTEILRHDDFAELVEQTASYNAQPFLIQGFTRDKLGRIIRRTETLGTATNVFAYKYDLAGRLVEVTRNGLVISTYSYDASGNRLSRMTTDGSVNGIYDSQDRLTQYGAVTYTYTPAGHLLSKIDDAGQPLATYSYDALGNLRAAALVDGSVIEYLLDGRNRRVGKKVGGVTVQALLYQDELRPVAELDGNGAVRSVFVYGSRANVPDYMVRGGVKYRIIADHLGSPRLVVDTGTGAVAQWLDYDEFGRMTLDTSPGFQPFGFAGGLYDPLTKLVRFGVRDYDAETGRWTAKDPISFWGGDTNLYAYARMDPINYSDMTGLKRRIETLGPCPDEEKCQEQVLRDYFGDNWTENVIPSFSLRSALPGSRHFSEWWKSFIEASVVKGGVLGGMEWLGLRLLKSGLFWDNLASTGTSLVATSKVGIWGITALGVGLGSAATTMDIIAFTECKDLGPNPTLSDWFK